MSTNVNEDRKRLKELLNEASDLEKELKKQEQQKRRIKNAEVAPEIEEEAEFLRNCLIDLYEEILLIDLKFASENGIEEKLWRNVFYSHVEELRQKLRKVKPERAPDHQAAYLELCRYLDLGAGFYHTIINHLKIRESIDLDRIGVEIFTKVNGEGKNGSPSSRALSKIRKKELAAECIQRCLIYLGDFARYRETVISLGEKRWEYAKQFYTKAARVYCDYGKAQGQLAVLASYSNKELDVVYWYSFSLATKQPSPIAAENLKTFYAKFQLAQANPVETVARLEIDKFTNQFLAIHRLLFDEEVEILKQKVEEIGKLKDRFELLVSSPPDNIQNLGTIFKKIIFILIFTFWDYRNGSVQARIVELRHVQLTTVSLGLGFCISVLDQLAAVFGSESDSPQQFLPNSAIECLPALILWCEYLSISIEAFLQLYTFAKTCEKDGDLLVSQFIMNVSNFVKTIVTLFNTPKVSLLLGEIKDLAEFARLSVPEDVEFLGVIPLRILQHNIKFNISKKDDIFKTRLARLFVCVKRLAEFKSFDLISINETTGQFILFDGAARKKERQRISKLMAQQLLQEQVQSLEQKLTKMEIPARLSSKPHPLDGEVPAPKLKLSTKQCVVDISVVTKHLKLVRKWITEATCTVIVPLNVIDSLDVLKKGDKQENARAREAIRFLDQQFQKRHPEIPIDEQRTNHVNNQNNLIIAQKLIEKISPWVKVEAYIDDMFDSLDPRESNNMDATINSKSRDSFNVMHIPTQYRPVLSCCLYYVHIAQLNDIILVTDDEGMAKHARIFNLPVCTPANV